MLQACIGGSCFRQIKVRELPISRQVAETYIRNLCFRQIKVFKVRQIGQAFQSTIRDVRFCEAKHVEVFKCPDVTETFIRGWCPREVDPHYTFKIPWPLFSDPFRYPLGTVER